MNTIRITGIFPFASHRGSVKKLLFSLLCTRRYYSSSHSFSATSSIHEQGLSIENKTVTVDFSWTLPVSCPEDR